MVFWNEIELGQIETVPTGRDRVKFRYQNGPLRFQVPKGRTTWGVSQFKSMVVDITHPDLAQWWSALETHLCPQEPFKSNMGPGPSLRLKIDEGAYIFDENSKQICPDIREGLFRGQDVTCIIDVDSTYFFNGNWGLTVRIYQLKTSGPNAAASPDEPSLGASAGGLKPGVCAFLPADD